MMGAGAAPTPEERCREMPGGTVGGAPHDARAFDLALPIAAALLGVVFGGP